MKLVRIALVLIATAVAITTATFVSVATATTNSNTPEYWESRTTHESECYYFQGGDGSPYGSVTSDGTSVTLNPFDPTWMENGHWELLVVKAGSDGNGGGDAVYDHPTAGTAYSAPINPANGKPFGVSHWIVCLGSTPTPDSTSVTWTVADGTCESPQGTLTVEYVVGEATYSGNAPGTYDAGESVSGTFTAADGYVIDGQSSFGPHVFVVSDGPCTVPADPQVTPICRALILSNPLGEVPPGYTQEAADFVVNGDPITVAAGESSTYTFEEDGDGSFTITGDVELTGEVETDCDDNTITPPVLTASYDCVTESASYSLTPSSSDEWYSVDGIQHEVGSGYSIVLLPAAGYTFGDQATGDDGSLTLTAPYTVDTECEVTPVEPTFTPPTCESPGSVGAPDAEAYTWNVTGPESARRYVAEPKEGYRLTGQVEFGPYDLSQLSGDDCSSPPTTTPPTTTPPTTTPPTTREPSIDVAAFSPVCQADTPYIEYRIEVSGTSATTARLTFLDGEGKVVRIDDDQPLEGRVIYPGASEDPDWPGWKLNSDGFWVVDPSDDHWRDGLTVRVEVNPTATAAVSYPPSTAICFGPPASGGPTTTVPTAAQQPPPTGQLPRTGSDATRNLLIVATLLLAVGVLLTAATRRRTMH